MTVLMGIVAVGAVIILALGVVAVFAQMGATRLSRATG